MRSSGREGGVKMINYLLVAKAKNLQNKNIIKKRKTIRRCRICCCFFSFHRAAPGLVLCCRQLLKLFWRFYKIPNEEQNKSIQLQFCYFVVTLVGGKYIYYCVQRINYASIHKRLVKIYRKFNCYVPSLAAFRK